MKVSILFSGGKDSALAAIMLSKFFDVKLITCSFGTLSNWKEAEKAAQKLKFAFEVFNLDKKILERAAEQTFEDGFPNNGIKYIHLKALEEVGKKKKIIADGVRRNDRVPVLSSAEIMQLEDKFDIHYLQPLMGYSRKTVNLLVKKYFLIKEYTASDSFIGAEYEFELREIVQKKYGIKKAREIFPQDHTHSYVKSVINLV
ncbi:alpha hydrolase [Candidatus Parcubacteria bacterium]|nr:alpha hydrolase [Candidatus Parcubacteria bacterium]